MNSKLFQLGIDPIYIIAIIAAISIVALVLSVILVPLLNSTIEGMFWFYSGHFSVTPVLIMIPIFALVGFLIPAISYKGLTKVSVVERIRELG